MNIQQLRYLTEIADRGLNLSKAAQSLHTSQPGISRQIRLLEEEIKADLLVRQGNRITALTGPGQQALAIARRVLRELENLRRVGEDAADESKGSLVIATTHAHARYVLIPVVQQFQARFLGKRVREAGRPATGQSRPGPASRRPCPNRAGRSRRGFRGRCQPATAPRYR